MSEEYLISRSFSRISTIPMDGGNYLQGIVFTPICCVSIYSQGNGTKKQRAYTCIDFSFNGIHYRKTWNKRFTKIGLARLANRFVRECLFGGE